MQPDRSRVSMATTPSHDSGQGDAMSQNGSETSNPLNRIMSALNQIEGRLSSVDNDHMSQNDGSSAGGSVVHSTASVHSHQSAHSNHSNQSAHSNHSASYAGYSPAYANQVQTQNTYGVENSDLGSQYSQGSNSGQPLMSQGMQPPVQMHQSMQQPMPSVVGGGSYGGVPPQQFNDNASHFSFHSQPGSQYTQSQYSQVPSYTQSAASGYTDSQMTSYTDVSKTGTSVSGIPSSSQGTSALPVYYQQIIGDGAGGGETQTPITPDNGVGRLKSLEKNPVGDMVSDRQGLILILGIVFLLNLGVFLTLFMRRLFPPPRDSFLRSFPLEAFALIAFVLLKMIVSWFYNPKPDMKVMVDGEPILVFIPIYNEPEDILAKTLGAIHNQTYSNRSITLMIVVDHDAGGLVNVLNVVMADIGDGVENPVTGDLEYRGTFNDMAYLIVMKRHHSGKHGSEIILVRYLQKHPADFKYLVTVDSDTILHPDAVSNIVTALDRSDNIIAACGKVMIANETATLMTKLQAFIYTVNHIVDKHFQGFIDFITCLPGCFCVIRVEPLVNPEKDYWGIHLDKNHQLNYTREAITALDRNLLLMGEDRWRTNLLLFARVKGEKIMYVPYAGCDTFCPETLQQYIAQQRRWFISTVVNQIILLSKGRMWFKNPIGCFTELISLFGSLVMPVICLFLFSTILLIIWDLNNLGFISALVVLGMLGFTCYLHGRFKHILYVWIYLPLAPVIMIYIPFYSFATFASDSWGTRGSRKQISMRQKQHLYFVYFATFVLTIIMLTVMFCSTVGTQCFF